MKMSKITDAVKCGEEIYWGHQRIKMNPGQEYSIGVGCVVLQLNPMRIVRYSSHGNKVYEIKLSRNGTYRFGPSFGHYVKEASAEKDPILRVLRERNIPISVLKRIDGRPCTMTDYIYDNKHCPKGGRSDYTCTDGRARIINTIEDIPRSGFFNGAWFYEKVITDYSYILRFTEFKSMTGTLVCQLSEVLAAPHCTAETLKEALEKNQ
jgi:hypothetical protein